MRSAVIAGITVIVGFAIGVLGISRLTTDSPVWVRVTLAFIWLIALIAAAYLLGNKSQLRMPDSRHRLRDGLLYLGIALVVVTAIVAVTTHDLDKGIHRNIRENWIICVITAAVVIGYTVKGFWDSRRCWRMWAVLAAYAALHFGIGVPALGRLQRVPAGFIWPIAMFEFIAVMLVLDLVTMTQAANRS